MSRSCLKFAVVFFNGFLMLIGAAALGVGIWVLVNDEGFLDDTADIIDFDVLGSDLLETCALAMITAGAVVFVLGMMGCIGAFALSSFLLVFYSLALVVLLTVEVAVVVLALVFRSELNEKIDQEVLDRLKTRYGDDKYSFTKSFDSLQDEFDCCGWESGKDYENVSRTAWNVTMDTGGERKVPDVCCRSSNETLLANCAMDPFTNYYNVTQYIDKGCKEQVEDTFEEYIWVVIGVTIGLLAFQFLLIVLSLCLVVTNVGKKYNM